MSEVFSGLVSFLSSSGRDEPQGMPATFRLLNGMLERGYEVHLLIQATRYGQPSMETLNNRVIVHRFSPYFLDFWKNLRGHYRFLEGLVWMVYLPSALMSAIKLVKKLRPNVIYTSQATGIVAYVVGRWFRIPVVRRLYGTFLYPMLGSRLALLRRPIQVWGFTLPCDALVVTNDGTQGDQVSKALRVPQTRFHFWLNGVEKNIKEPSFDARILKTSIGLDPDDVMILSVNRLVDWKRTDRLIRVMPLINSRSNNVKYVIVGDGPERSNLERLVEQLGVTNQVLIKGSVPAREVACYLNTADLFVSLYDLSNVGNSLLEAMSCGKCVVALDVGGTSDIVKNGVTGKLIKPDELNGLPDVIVMLVENENLRAQLAQRAYEFAQENLPSWAKRINMELDLIEHLAAGKQEH